MMERELNPAHTSQTFQAAGLWFGHLGCLPEAAALAAEGHCCPWAALESITLLLITGATEARGLTAVWWKKLFEHSSA